MFGGSLTVILINMVFTFTPWIAYCGGLVVSELDSGSRGSGSSPGRGHCVMFLDKTLHSHKALFPPRSINRPFPSSKNPHS